MANELIRAELFQTLAPVPLETRAAGSGEVRLSPAGNSILSTLFVASIDVGATLTVEYVEATTGDAEGENYILATHVTPAAGTAHKLVVTQIHNKPRLRWTVTGGNVRFGVYITIVSSFASQQDQALVSDGETADLATALALQTSIYDPSDGKFYFARGMSGVQDVNIVGDSFAPLMMFKNGDTDVTTPLVEQELISQTVPSGKFWRIRNIQMVCSAYGWFSLEVDSVRKAKGLNSPNESNVVFNFTPPLILVAGEELKVKFTETHGPITDVQAFVMYTEENA